MPYSVLLFVLAGTLKPWAMPLKCVLSKYGMSAGARIDLIRGLTIWLRSINVFIKVVLC